MMRYDEICERNVTIELARNVESAKIGIEQNLVF